MRLAGRLCWSTALVMASGCQWLGFARQRAVGAGQQRRILREIAAVLIRRQLTRTVLNEIRQHHGSAGVAQVRRRGRIERKIVWVITERGQAGRQDGEGVGRVARKRVRFGQAALRRKTDRCAVAASSALDLRW